MNEKIRDKDQASGKPEQRDASRRLLLAIAGALVVIIAVVIGLNVGGVRDRLLGGGAPPIKSIAVLPFENLSHDPAQDSFADAVTQTLIGYLQPIGTLRVISASSVMRYKKAPKPLPEVARELNIDGVVEGGVLRLGDRVRIMTNLIHASTNRHVWEQTYERDLLGILTVPGEVARAIAREIRAELTPEQEARLAAPGPANAQASEAYLQAIYGGTPAKREAYLEQTIQLDPAYARAYDSLAAYHLGMFPVLPFRDVYPKAREIAQKAISLGPNVALLSHRALAAVALEYDWDFVEAEKEFKRAVELMPNGSVSHHTYAHFLMSVGRMEEARAETRRALELDPLGSSLIACASWHDIAEGNYDDAEKHASQALSLGAPDQLARLTLGWSYALRGRHEEAIAEFQKAVVGWKGAVLPTAVLGHGYAVAGKVDAAQEVLNGLLERSKTEYVSAYEIAVIYAGLGDKDRAFEWLEKAFEERATLLVYFRMDPRIWSLRSDPRFQGLLGRMNFPKDRRD